MNLKTQFVKNYGALPNILVAIVITIAFVGFIDASYLTVKRYLGSPLTCYFFGGCERVNASPYSMLFGLPLSLYGTSFYLFVILSGIRYIQKKSELWAKALMALTTIGLLFSLYFAYLQEFVIGAWCFYCVVSLACSTTNFLIMSFGWRKYVSSPRIMFGEGVSQ